jgi:hypothetical protein
MDLTDDQVDDLRRQLGVAPPAPSTGELLDAASVAELLSVSRDYVYSHAAELGGEKLGDGPRPRWRFDPARVAAARSESVDAGADDEVLEPSSPPVGTARRRPRATPGGAPLLAVRGDGPYAGATTKATPGRRVNANRGPDQRRVSSNG